MLALTLTADLHNLTALVPLDTPESPFYYTLQLQCTACRETHANWVGVSRFETYDPPSSKTSALAPPNLVFKCRNCTRTHTLLLPSAPTPYRHPEDETAPVNKVTRRPERRQTLLVMDCRGLEVVGFRPEGVWMAKGLESGTAFEEVKLEEGNGGRWEFFDFDEKAGEEVSLTEGVFEVVRA